MWGLSDGALDVCARWFAMTPGSTVVSHEPHAKLSGVRPAVDELIAAGIITEQPYNRLGSILLTGSERAVEIGRVRQQEIMARMWGDAPPASSDRGVR